MKIRNYKTSTIKDTRDNLSAIIDQVAIAGETFVVTKFGKPKAMITPVKNIVDKDMEKRKKVLEETFGMWKDREDMKDAVVWVRKIRKKSSSRYGKIFG